jgi:DNA-binding response OmpR family regulator
VSQRVAVVADDLIWSTRLREQLEAAGARPLVARDRPAVEAALPDIDAAIVDLTARRYDPVELIGIVAGSGRPVAALGQHDDREGRLRARIAGADRVFAYRQLSEDGARLLGSWLTSAGSASAVPPSEPSSGHGR